MVVAASAAFLTFAHLFLLRQSQVTTSTVYASDSTMNNLPQELIDRICEHLPCESLKQTLFVSRKFQYATERASGVFSKFQFLNEDPKEAQQFLKVYGGYRFHYLHRVEVYSRFPALQPTYLPPTRRDIRKRRDPVPASAPEGCMHIVDLESEDQMFYDQVARCFEAIKKVEDRSEHIGRIQLTLFTPIRRFHKSYCNILQCPSWRVHLLLPEQLPKLNSVQGLSVCNFESYHSDLVFSKIDLRMIVDLAARCPNLHYLGCKIGTNEWATTDEDYRHEAHTRKEFADAVHNTELPSSLRYVQLNFIDKAEDRMNDQRKQLPDLVYPVPFDPFSSSLRLLSYKLRRVELRVIADETLFWPHSDDSDISSFWPSLESLNVMFSIGMPSGSWYFKGPLGEGRDTKGYRIQEDEAHAALRNNDDGVINRLCGTSEQAASGTKAMFRVTPLEETINSFLEAFANAATNMAKLKEALLWTPLYFSPEGTTDSDDEYEEISEQGQRYLSRRLSSYDLTAISQYPEASLAWGIAYVAPGGAPFDDGEANCPSRQFWWRVGQWRPNTKLHEAFQKIGKAQNGAPPLEYWTDSIYGDGLVERDWFTRESVFPHVDERYPAYCWLEQCHKHPYCSL
ncbi:hypothetical protein SLS60_011204 [Paraconiothyrium brasiliense]|uniref:F-box domain-containing protein n=1 Tax=Paraconiothyrium brasiliense TaxID=300254 RepID=A0ABR3QLF1_9PLEO